MYSYLIVPDNLCEFDLQAYADGYALWRKIQCISYDFVSVSEKMIINHWASDSEPKKIC